MRHCSHWYPKQLVVPNVGMAKWLRYQIAETLGVAADLNMVLAERFFQDLVSSAGNYGPNEDRAYLVWRLAALLPTLLHRTEFSPLAHYLEAQQGTRGLLGLAEQLAALYQTYYELRPDWLANWEAGATLDVELAELPDWQSLLWHEVINTGANAAPGKVPTAARLSQALAHLQKPGPALALPERVSFFAPGTLTPTQLQFLSQLSAHRTIHLLHACPCQEFWSDLVDERTLARWRISEPERAQAADIGHPLLASWGKSGMTQFEMLLEHEQGDLHQDYHPSEAPGLLGQIQRDILQLQTGHGVARPGDESLLFACAPSPLRELEALHDHLLDRFAADSQLTPRDVLVLAPDMKKFVPAIDAVFGGIELGPAIHSVHNRRFRNAGSCCECSSCAVSAQNW